MDKSNEGQYFWKAWENGELIHQRTFDDPFVVARFEIKGWAVAWKVLRGRFALRCQMDGTRPAHRVVFTGDYTEDIGPPKTMEDIGPPKTMEALGGQDLSS